MSAGRDNNGRFAPGNPGGPGRPPRPVEEDYLATIRSGISEQDLEKITRRAVEDAIKGDPRARDWITKLAVGDRLPIVEAAGSPANQKIIVEYVDDWYGEISDDAKQRIAEAQSRYQETGKLEALDFGQGEWASPTKQTVCPERLGTSGSQANSPQD